MFDPTTWPKQAKLAAKGKWDELQALKDSLQGGRE
jgi:small subunit ribosomal protein S2